MTRSRCAYCHHALGGGEVEACPTCHTPHHAECWEENGGCAVALCESGPKLPYMPPTEAQLAAPTGRMTVSFDESGAVTEAPGAELARRRRRRRALRAAVAGFVLLLLVAGMLAFLIASKSSETASLTPPSSGARSVVHPPAQPRSWIA